MTREPVAIVLGGTVPHKFLIKELKERGYRTVLIDYYDNPPASEIADEHIQESTLDKQTVLKIAKSKKASLVISGCIDQANVTACYVSEKLGLPVPYSFGTSLRVTDKMLMKEGLIKAGVKTAVHEVVKADNLSSFKVASFPKVVKPCDTNGSKGVRKVVNAQELTSAIKNACSLSRSGKAIVEEYNKGYEINGYYFIGLDNVYELFFKRKELPANLGLSSLQSFMSIGPENLPDLVKGKLLNIAKNIGSEFGLKNTPLLIQANIDHEEVNVIEFAPRVGGGLAFREIKMHTGFDIINSVIDSYLNDPVTVSVGSRLEELTSVVHLFGESGIFHKLEGMEALLNHGHIEEYHLHKLPGAKLVKGDLASRNRILGLIIKGESVSEIVEKIKYSIMNLKVLSKDGSDLLRRDVFMNDNFITC